MTSCGILEELSSSNGELDNRCAESALSKPRRAASTAGEGNRFCSGCRGENEIKS